LERLLPPPRARSFRGRVVVHDASSRELVTIAERGGQPVRSHRELVEADLVVVVTAAETVVDGGPGALVAASDAATVRATASTTSLLELSGSGSWDLVLAVEAALAEQVPLVGLSLVLDLPRAGGSLPGLDRDPEAGRSLGRIARAELRAAFSLLPGVARRAALDQRARSLAATAAFAGPPSVAHAEALLRGVELRGARLERPVDALVVGVPWFGPHLPRSPANPLTVAAAALGLALRLHRDAFPVRDGGTLVVLHPLRRSFQDVEQAPYGELYDAVRLARGASELEAAEAAAGSSGPALEAYRRGLACHPLQPFADWAGCTPALSRLGRVVVAGCRDAIAARALGFVPARSIGSALEMAHGVAGGAARVGILVGPPYPPQIVGARA